MAKIFETQFHKGSYIERVSKVAGTPNDISFKRKDKGLNAYSSVNTGNIDFGTTLGNKLGASVSKISVVIACRIDGSNTNNGIFNITSFSSSVGVIRLSVSSTNNLLYSIESNSHTTTYEKGKDLLIIATYDSDAIEKKLWVNGDIKIDVSATGTFDTTGLKTIVNSYYSNAYGLVNGGCYNVQVYDHILTVNERAQAYEDFLNAKPLIEEKHPKYGPWNKPTDLSGEVDKGLIGAYNFIYTNGLVVDISGRGSNLESVGSTPSSSLKGVHFSGKNYLINTGVDNTLLNPGSNDFTISFRVKIPTIPVSSKYIYGKGGGGSKGYGGYINSFGQINSDIHDGTTRVTTPSIEVLTPGQFYNINFVYDRDSVVTIYINGVEDTTEDISSVSDPIDMTTKLSFGCVGALIAPLECEFEDWRIDTYAYTAQQVKDYHNEFASRVVLQDNFLFDPVGAAVPREWRKGTGVYVLKELAAQDSVLKELDIGTKYMECVSPGRIAIPNPFAYGTPEFYFYQGGVSNNVYIFPISTRSDPSISNGYRFRVISTEALQLRRNDNGVYTDLFGTAASYISTNTWYGAKLPRTKEGKFTASIKGGVFGNAYTLIDPSGGSGTNPVTDNTHTISNYFVLDFAAGDRIILKPWLKGVLQ